MKRPGAKEPNYVGLKTNLRKPAVFLLARWRSRVGRVDVRKSLALADDLLCRWTGVPGGGARGVAETS